MIEHLKLFCRVVSNGNISKTAEEIHMSQPALSMALQRLEKDLDVKLFERTSRGVKLTKIGVKILPYAMEICKQYENIGKEIEQYRRNSQTLKIGGSMQHNAMLASRFIAERGSDNVFYRQFLDFTEMKAELASGGIDIALASPPLKGASIITITMFRERFGILVSKNNWLSKLDSVTIDDIKNMKIVGQPPNFPISIAIKKCMDNAGVRLTTHIQAENNAIFDLLRGKFSENFVAIYPEYRGRSISEEYSNIVWIPISTPGFEREIAVSYLNDGHNGQMISTFMEYCKQFYDTEFCKTEHVYEM